jgi:hypothetical protein
MPPIGSGYGDDEYRRRKNAHDALEKSLRDHGVPAEKAKELADKTARETDNKQRQTPPKPKKQPEGQE